MLTELQKLTAQAIVNVFETGKARGDYGRVSVMRGDTGHLTYGRSQTTLAIGNLYLDGHRDFRLVDGTDPDADPTCGSRGANWTVR